MPFALAVPSNLNRGHVSCDRWQQETSTTTHVLQTGSVIPCTDLEHRLRLIMHTSFGADTSSPKGALVGCTLTLQAGTQPRWTQHSR
jgi:hypothetical protein